MRDILKQIDHRPWLKPAGSWVMAQTWHTLLFAHWPVPVEVLRPLIPAALEIDTFDGQAWLGVVPFRMSHVRPRMTPSAPWLSFFPELNVRTYVTVGGKPGVWFFSLDAANSLAVAIARRWFHLPYFNATMISQQKPDHTIIYRSTRIHRNAPPAVFEAQYKPTGEVYLSQPGTLEHWLTERYCLYAQDQRSQLYRGEIHHVPWPLQPAEAHTEANTMAAAAGIDLPDSTPLLHYAHKIKVAVWPLEKLD